MTDNSEKQLIWVVVGFIFLFGIVYFHSRHAEEERMRNDYLIAKQSYREIASEELDEKSYLDLEDGSDCTQDCSGHEAGFEWAKENNIDNPTICDGYSQSFIEGCETYARELDSIWNHPEEREDFQETISIYIESSYPSYDY